MGLRTATLVLATAAVSSVVLTAPAASASSAPAVFGYALASGDMDGDGLDDLVDVRQSVNVAQGFTTMIARRGRDGHVLWSRTVAWPAGGTTKATVLRSGRHADVLLRSSASVSSGSSTDQVTVTTEGFTLFDGRTGARLWSRQLSGSATSVTSSSGGTTGALTDVPYVVNEDDELGNLVGGPRSDPVLFLVSGVGAQRSDQLVVLDGGTGAMFLAGAPTNVLNVRPAGMHTLDGYQSLAVYSEDEATGQTSAEVRNALGLVVWSPLGEGNGTRFHVPVQDLDQDGFPEMVQPGSDVVVRSGLTGAVLLTAPGRPAENSYVQPGVAPTPAAGLATVVDVATPDQLTSTVRVLGPTGDPVWQRDLDLPLRPDDVGSSELTLVGDETGDGVGDVGLVQSAWPRYSGPGVGRETLLDGRTGAVVRTGPNEGILGRSLAVTAKGVPASLDGFGTDYVYGTADPKNRVHVRARDGRTGKAIWDQQLRAPSGSNEDLRAPVLHALAGTCGALLVTTWSPTLQRTMLLSGRTGLPVWSYDVATTASRAVAPAIAIRPGSC